MMFWPIKHGAAVCDDHKACVHVVLEVTKDGTIEPLDDLELEYRGGCLLCNTEPVEGRSCANLGCEADLHPRWPAIYCSPRCAREDA